MPLPGAGVARRSVPRDAAGRKRCRRTDGAGVNYLLNYHFTFASKLAHRITLPRFLAVAVISAALNGVGMWFATTRLGVHYLLAQLGCTTAVLLLGYALNAVWTFRSRGPNSAGARLL